MSGDALKLKEKFLNICDSADDQSEQLPLLNQRNIELDKTINDMTRLLKDGKLYKTSLQNKILKEKAKMENYEDGINNQKLRLAQSEDNCSQLKKQFNDEIKNGGNKTDYFASALQNLSVLFQQAPHLYDPSALKKENKSLLESCNKYHNDYALLEEEVSMKIEEFILFDGRNDLTSEIINEVRLISKTGDKKITKLISILNKATKFCQELNDEISQLKKNRNA